jgi:hypothetical protein
MLTRFCNIDVSKVMQTVVLGWQCWHWPTGCPHWLQNLAGCMMLIGCISGCRILFRADVTVNGVVVVVVVFIGAFCVVFWAFAADKSRLRRTRG